MNAKTLMDSRKFCMAMDDLVRTWKKGTDQDKELRLDAVLALVGPAPVVMIAPTTGIDGAKIDKPKRVYTKRVKAALDLTPEETKTYAAMADKAKAEVPDVHARMARMMAAHVLPQVRAGKLSIAIPNEFEGRPLPSSNKTWLQALQSIGIHREEIEWGTSADGLPASASPMHNMRYLKLG